MIKNPRSKQFYVSLLRNFSLGISIIPPYTSINTSITNPLPIETTQFSRIPRYQTNGRALITRLHRSQSGSIKNKLSRPPAERFAVAKIKILHWGKTKGQARPAHKIPVKTRAGRADSTRARRGIKFLDRKSARAARTRTTPGGRQRRLSNGILNISARADARLNEFRSRRAGPRRRRNPGYSEE